MILDVINESGFELGYATDGSIGLDLREEMVIAHLCHRLRPWSNR